MIINVSAATPGPSIDCSHAIVPGVAPVTVNVVPAIVPVKLLVNTPIALLVSGNVKPPAVPNVHVLPDPLESV